MKEFLGTIFLLSIFFFIQSCDNKPFACFKTDIDEDSIHVNQLVAFTSACTSNGKEYFWEFYGNDDSVLFTRNVQKIFYDTGTVKVFLLVTNGNKTSSMTKDIHVKP